MLFNLAACGKKDTAPGADGAVVVKIGSIQPLTGPQSHLGKDNENGTRMAIDDANAKGISIGGKKVRFELFSEDDQADPKTATIVAQKMVDEKVNGIIGHLNSGTTIPASKIYFDAGIVQISPSATNPKYTEQGFRTAFRVMPNDVQQGKALGDFAVTRLGAKRVAIIDDRTAYGQGLADQFGAAAKAAGAEIVTRQYTTDKSTDFMAILTAVKSENADVLFFGGMDAQGGPMMKQFKTLGLNAKFLMGDGGSTPEFIKLAAGSAEGAYSSLPGLPLDKMPGGKAFGDKFTAKYGQIQLYAPYCYDAVSVMIAAMQKADSIDPAKYLPVLASIVYDGVTAKISFDTKGDIKDGAITLYQVKNGKWEVLETVGGAEPAK
ncbi:MAG: branched-chain amino acid ABC transporter substrate-binding protein [Sulfuricella denitrificans]|nr:branched-chain amino acid ABC transporter substrate-binding protein [Sulfuricella denitrificans]